MANTKLQQDILKKAKDRIAGKGTQTSANKTAQQSVIQKAQNIANNRVMVQPQMDATRQRALDMVRNNIRRRQEDTNVQDNLANRQLYSSRATTIAPTGGQKLRQGLYEETLKKIGGQIENEQNIINNQGRAEDDPARIRATEELEKLLPKQAEAQANLDSVKQPEKTSLKSYTPEEEAYIRRIQQRIEKGQNRKQQPGFAYTPEMNSLIHLRNTPESTDEAGYVDWLKEGAQLGMYNEDVLNAMLQQTGNAKPYEQYKALSDKYKSSWGDYKNNAELMRIYGLQSAWEYGENYDYTNARDALLEKQNYYTGQKDAAQADLDAAMAADTPEARERNNRYRMLGGEIPLAETWEEEPPEEFLDILRSGKKPEDYDAHESDYDAMMYDFIYGTGAWNREFINGTDEEADRAFDRVEDLWDRFENGTAGELAEKTNIPEYQSKVGYYSDQLGDVNKQLNAYLKVDELMRRYEGISGADYDPEIDRGRTTLWTYDDENYDPNVPYASPYTSDVHRIYSFINKGKEYQAYLDFVAGGNVDNAKVSEAYAKTALMNPEMKRKFNDLYTQGRYDEASAFLEGLSPYLNAMYSDYEHIYTEEQARQTPITSSAASLGAELMSGPVGVVRTAAGLLGDQSVADPNSEWYRTTRYNEQTQQAVADMIGGEGGKIYLQGMNTLRNMMNVAAVSLLGVPAGAQSAAGLAMFATQIYQDSTYKYLSEGNDYTKASMYALLDAALETAEEKLPYEAILAGGNNIFISWLANSISEALEEFTGATVGEEIKAHLIGGGRSEWVQNRDKIYNEGGYTDENGQWVELDKTDSRKALAEAEKQALKEYGQQVIDNTLAGFVGGGLGAGYNVAQSYINTRKLGGQIRNRNNVINGQTGPDQLISAARGMNKDTQSYKLAEAMFKKTQKGKEVSNYQLGKLAAAMDEETTGQVAEIARQTVERSVMEELTQNGVDNVTAEEIAPAIVEAAIKGDASVISQKAQTEIVKSVPAVNVLKSFLTPEGQEETIEKVTKATEKPMNIRQTVSALMKDGSAGVTLGGVFASDVAQAAKRADIATQEELDKAKGTQHDNGLDAIVDGEIVQVTGMSDGKVDILKENGEHTSVTVGEVQAAGEAMGTLLNFADVFRNVLDDGVFSTIVAQIENNKKLNGAKYVNDAVNTYIGYMTGNEVKTSALADKTVEAIKTVAEKAAEKVKKERLDAGKKYTQAKPGEGALKYDGAEYGTQEFTDKLKGLTRQQRNQAGALGELVKRLGVRVNLVNEDNNDVFGYEDNSGTLYINIGAKDQAGGRQNILTVAGHELTHWLEHTSETGYDELQKFVLDRMRKNGANIEALVLNTIDRYRAIVKQDLSIAKALSEIVANACDQVLANEEVAKALNEENPGLFRQVKGFVKDFLARVKAATNYDPESTLNSSIESRVLMKGGQEVMDELARIYMGARQEAISRQAQGTETAEDTGKSYSVRQMNDEYMQAVEKGDTEKEQQLVEQAAKDAGYTMKVYHGTPTGGFTVFKDWSYFTQNKEYADRYNHASASSTRGRYETTTPQTYELYMKPGKVFDTREAKARSLYNKYRTEYGLNGLDSMERGVPDWTDGRDVIDMIEEHNLDYDTIVLDEGGDGGYGEEVKDRGLSYVTRANMVKSAEPVTYDNDGNVIPLDQRFNEENNDIRYNVRQDAAEINRWMMGMTDSSLNTTQERLLIKQYQSVLKNMDITRGIRGKYEDELKKLQGKKNPSEYDRFRMKHLQDLIDDKNAKLDASEKKLLQITTGEGYAAIMFREHSTLDNLVNGRTANEVKQTIDAIAKQIENAQDDMNRREQEIRKLAETEAVRQIQALMSGKRLDDMAKWLRTSYDSHLNKEQLMAEMSQLRLRMAAGEDITFDAGILAQKLVNEIHGEKDAVLEALRGMTLTMTQNQIHEIAGKNGKIIDVQRMLAGTGIKVQEGENSRINANWDELTDMVPALASEENQNPQNQAAAIVRLAQERLRRWRDYGIQKYRDQMESVTNDVLAAVAAVDLDVPTDPKAMAVLRRMNGLIKAMAGSLDMGAKNMAEVRQKLIQMARTGQLASDLTNKMKKDMQAAIWYNNLITEQSEAFTWAQERNRLLRQLRSEQTQAVLDEQLKWKTRIAQDKANREKAAENMKLRRQIHTNIGRIRTMIVNETDKKNVPEAYKPIAREMLMMIIRNDLAGGKPITGFDDKMLREAFDYLRGLNSRDGRFTVDDLQALNEDVREEVAIALADIQDGIQKYNVDTKGRKLAENLEDFHKGLELINNGVITISNVINHARSVNYMDRERALDAAAADVIRDMRRIKKEPVGKGAKTYNAVNRSVIYGNTTPVYFIKNLKNGGINELWHEFESAENRNGLELSKAKDFMDRVAEEYHYKDWDLKKKYTVTMKGYPVQMTVEQMMALYATWQREKMIGPEESFHLPVGGIILDNDETEEGKPRMERREQKARKVEDADIAKMLNLLTNDQKKYVHRVVGYLSKEMSELGNEASMRMYGIKKYNEKWYFPFKVWNGVLSARSDKGITGTDENRAAHKSWSKRRKNNAGNALVIGNFTDTAVKHIVEMINYNTFAPAIENLNKVLNYQTVSQDINGEEERRNVRIMFREAYGKEALRYLEDWLKDLQGGATQDQRKTMRDRLLSTFKKNAVAGSMSVALQQPMSYIRANMMISPKYMTQALAKEYWKGTYQERLKHSGVSVIKDMGRFDMNFGQSAMDWISPEEKRNLYEKASDYTTKLPELMDRWTWNRMWVAVKLEQAALHPEMDTKSDAFLDMVGERFNDVMRKTQVYDSTMVKSSNMRSQNLSMKIITSFMAEPTLSLNVLADAVLNAKEKGGKATLAKAGATFLLSAAAQAFFKGLMGSGRTPDEKKTWAENFLAKFWQNLMSEANPVSLVPGYSDIIEVLKNGELKDDAMGVIGKLKTVITTAQNMFDPEKSKGWYRSLEDTVGQVAQLFTNIPAKNLMRDVRAMYNWISGAKYADRETSGAVIRQQTLETLLNADNLTGVINGYLGDAGYKTTNKAYFGRMYGAMKAGNQAGADEIKEYLQLGKDVTDEKIESGVREAAKSDSSLTPAEQDQWMIDNGVMDKDNIGTITTQYKAGEITEAEAKKLYKAAKPELTDDDIYWKIDRINFQKETGAEETPGGEYYRLGPALETNRSADIKAEIDKLLQHGKTKEGIKTQLGKELKTKYLEANNADKVKIRNELQAAYRALGLTAADANKIIDGWVKEAKKSQKKN